MSSLIARYNRAPHYAWLAAIAAVGALASAWMGMHWSACFIAATLFALSAAAVGILAVQPSVEIFEQHLAIGRWKVPWSQIREVDHSGWLVPLVVRLTLEQGERKLLLFPGDKESGTALLRLIRRMSCDARLDGLTYMEFWGEALKAPTDALKPPASSSGKTKPRPSGSRAVDNVASQGSKKPASDSASGTVQGAPARYPMLRPEDELEVEQMYQRLKSVGHLESRDSLE
jgi:hypothetical protein